MIWLAASLFLLTASLVIFVFCLLWAVLGVSLAAASGAPLPADAIDVAEKLYNCGGDEGCIRLYGSIVAFLKMDEPIFGMQGQVITYAAVAAMMFLISYAFTRSRLKNYEKISDSYGIKDRVNKLLPEMSRVRIELIRKKDAFACYPFSINKTIYFCPPLLSDQEATRFCLHHELFHCNVTFPVERVLFAAIAPATAVITAVLFPLAAFSFSDIGYLALPLTLGVLVAPNYFLRNLKSALYSCIESSADLYAASKLKNIPFSIASRERKGQASVMTTDSLQEEFCVSLKSLYLFSVIVVVPVALVILVLGSQLPAAFNLKQLLECNSILVLSFLLVFMVRLPRNLGFTSRLVSKRRDFRSYALSALWIFLILMLPVVLIFSAVNSIDLKYASATTVELILTVLFGENLAILICYILGFANLLIAFGFPFSIRHAAYIEST